MADLRDQLQSTLGDAYPIQRELSGGGMSRVFVAEDTTLGRMIVVKLLPHEMAAGVSIERFKREIQTAARLQHPHIVPLLSAGETHGLPFYTMPFVKGDSLRARLSRGGELSVNEAVHILRDVAAALAYAHSEGVVHRDIKPDNVIVSGGVAVVTDFGVSKAVDLASTTGDSQAEGLTSLGVALGTPAYMAPEQASADPQTDHRADIYSFGCLAYELLAGTSPFAGRPPQHMLAAHVTEDPDPLQKRRPNVPPALAALVMKCLQKHAGDRPQSADELLNSIDAIASTPSGGMAPTTERLAAVRVNSWRRLAIRGGGVAVVAIAAALLWGRVPSPSTYVAGSATPVARSQDIEIFPAISPDGKLVAFVSATVKGTRIFIQQIDGGRATLLTGGLDGDHVGPQWSPDGSRISFAAGNAIYVIPALGAGTPKRLIELAGATHAWSRDGKRIAYDRDGEIWAHDVDTGAGRVLVKGATLHSPSWSPDGTLIAYGTANPPTLTNLAAGSIWVAPVAGGTPVRISDSTHVNLSPVWTPDGRNILYVSNRENARDVYQQRVRANGSATGAPVRLTTSLGSFAISLSADGSRLAYDVVRNSSNIWSAAMVNGSASMVDAQQLTRENQHVETLALSHDGKWLAYDSDRGGNADIYKMRLDGGEPIQLTTSAAPEFAPSWSPDDREITYHGSQTGSRDIYVVSAEGTGGQHVTSGLDEDFLPAWSPDGREIAFQRGGAILVSVRGPNATWSAARTVLGDSTRSRTPRWSPDGAFLAVAMNGKVAIVSPGAGTPRVLADTAALHGIAVYVAWGRDASLVYAMVRGANDMTIVAVPVGRGPPRTALSGDVQHRFGARAFTTDGKRILFTIGQWESDVYVMALKH